MSKQQTLANFAGFMKKVVHCGEETNVTIPTMAKEETKPLEPCPHCDKRFKNKSRLSIHLKCIHGTAEINETGDIPSNQPSSSKPPNSRNTPNTPESSEQHANCANVDEDNTTEQVPTAEPNETEQDEAEQMTTTATRDQPADGVPSSPRKTSRRGQDKRMAHSVATKLI